MMMIVTLSAEANRPMIAEANRPGGLGFLNPSGVFIVKSESFHEKGGLVLDKKKLSAEANRPMIAEANRSKAAKTQPPTP